MIETTTGTVDGIAMLKAFRYSFEEMAPALLAIELAQGRERAEEVLASIDSEHLNKCVRGVYYILRQGAGL
jgi:hypothetical protein